MKNFSFLALGLALSLLLPVESFANAKQNIDVWGLSATVDDKGSDAIVRAFEAKHPEYHVRLLGMGAGQMNPQKLMTAIVGGAAPDVIKQDRFSISDWASRGAFTPLDEFIKRDQADPNCPRKEDYYDGPWQEAMYGGQVYGIPIGSDVRVLYWNRDIFKAKADKLREAGLDPERPPRTWSELDKYAVALEEKEKDGTILKVGALPNFGNTWLYMYSIQNKGAFVSEDGRRATFNTPANLEALTYMVKGYEKIGGRAQTRAFEQGFQTNENDPFLTGKVAMVVTGEWVLEGYNRYKPNLNFGSAPAPIPDDRLNHTGRFANDSQTFCTWTGGFAYAIPKGAKHPEGAWELIKFACSLEGRTIEMAAQSDLARSKGRRYIPRIWALKSAAQKSAEIYCNGNNSFDEAFRTHVKAMDYAQSRGATFAAQAVWDAQARAMQDAIDETKTPEEALKVADNDVQKILDEFYAVQDKPVADVKTPSYVAAILAVIGILGFGVFVKTNIRSKIAAQEATAGFMFITPWILGFLALTAGPMLASLFFSFTVYNVLSPARYVGVDNYQHIFTSDSALLWKGFANILYLAGIGIPLGNFLGLMVAMLLNTGIKGMRYFRTAFYLPAVLPGIVSAVLWMTLMNPSPDTGIINHVWHESFEQWFGVKAPGWLLAPEWAKPALILMGLWGVGSGMILWLAGLKSIPSTLYEAAQMDGANEFQKFWRVTIPQLTPLILFNLIMSVIAVMQTFDTVYVVTGGVGSGPSDSLLVPVVWLFQQGFTYFRMGYASALAWILFAIILALTGVNLALSRFWVHQEVRT